MARFVVVFALAFFSVAKSAYAFCVPGDVMACVLNGKHGTKTCGSNSMYGPCIVPPDPSCTAMPKYKVLTVVYAPPGRTGGGSGASSVAYGSGSSFGTTTSSSHGFKQA